MTKETTNQTTNKEALIIVDMSVDFVATDGGLTVGEPAQAIVPYIRELADDFLAAGMPVVIAMDAHQPNDPHFNLWPVHNVVDTKGQALYGELAEWYQVNQNETLVSYYPKENYNSFFQTGLAADLRKVSVETVHVVGVTTDICVFNTISGADAEGFKTVTHRRGVATFTALGEIMLEHMTRCFHTVVID
ncbi:cysteine hydrolase family protein [Fundicoccus sp. Sow4_F4]|uniref:cysteine hydrolase family protein n=1 Tax=Fundicoccus sp. Sow4_F4 TaxID=3438783 RepID=UPI003F8FDCE8